jgi:putative transposase
MSIVKRAYIYRFYPTDEQKQQLARTFGCCRYVYNWALALRQQTYQATGKSLSYQALDAQMTILRHQADTSFLSEVSCVPLQQSVRHLMRAYTNFFAGRADFPTWKSRQGPQSATYTRSAFS